MWETLAQSWFFEGKELSCAESRANQKSFQRVQEEESWDKEVERGGVRSARKHLTHAQAEPTWSQRGVTMVQV